MASLEKELADTQAAAGDATEAVTAQVTTAQEALADAKKAAESAKSAAGATRDQILVEAQVRVAEAQSALEAIKGQMTSGSAAPSPAASPSGAVAG